jgi:hypothetical protein
MSLLIPIFLVTITAADPASAVQRITSFEDRNPFEGGQVVREHATDGTRALRLDRGYIALFGAQDWSGHDFLKADVFTSSTEPLELAIEVHDRETKDYWTRVNYTTVVPPGASTLIVPTALFVGEKARPGRPLLRNAVTRLVLSIGDQPKASLFLDNLRLERDTELRRRQFAGLWAFDLGPEGSPLMEGFTPLDTNATYTKARGYGWNNAQIWRSFDALQPDPLYRDFLCVERGGLAIDVPNGSYHVFVNMDSPSGFWGEVPRYRRRALILEGKAIVDTLDMAGFKARYYRHWDDEDLPADNTFDKYQVPYFAEKQQTVEVRDGQLNIEFEGNDFACSVSAIIVFPAAKAAEGKRFLEFVRERRRFHFDNAFKRVLPRPSGEPPRPTAQQQTLGFVAFQRDPMDDVAVNDRPRPGEPIKELKGSAFAGEFEPITLSLCPLRDLGRVEVKVSALLGPNGATLPSSAIEVGHVRHRITRVTAEGSVYTISPRHIMPRASALVPNGVTRTFWLTVKTPPRAERGDYTGKVTIAAERGGTLTLPLGLTVRKGPLDPVDIPAGPFGHTIDLPWFEDEATAENLAMAAKSLDRLHAYGFTTASGLPVLTYQGAGPGGAPRIDFTRGDAQMRLFREHGFRMPVVSYCPFHGLNLYGRDDAAMQAAGISDTSAFVYGVFSTVQKHAQDAKWLPVYWNLCDEPVGEDVVRSAENAEAYRKAFPKGPPLFTGASSFQGSDASNPHFRLAKALNVVAWNLHDAAAVDLLHKAGGDWAFYNGGDRWTYGVYMYKAAKQYGMKYRLSWHWNVVAGDPYYALDCREDDYAWSNSSPSGELVPSVEFERLREGLDDYRRLLTLARLVREQRGKPAAQSGEKVLGEVLGSFELSDRRPRNAQEFVKVREQLDRAIENLR